MCDNVASMVLRSTDRCLRLPFYARHCAIHFFVYTLLWLSGKLRLPDMYANANFQTDDEQRKRQKKFIRQAIMANSTGGVYREFETFSLILNT